MRESRCDTLFTIRLVWLHQESNRSFQNARFFDPNGAVISPLPLCEKKPAKTGSLRVFPRGRMAVIPVQIIDPCPPSPWMRVQCPTCRPCTSVKMALNFPGVPSSGMPISLVLVPFIVGTSNTVVVCVFYSINHNNIFLCVFKCKDRGEGCSGFSPQCIYFLSDRRVRATIRIAATAKPGT